MINEKIYSKLTPSAQEELEKLTMDYRDELLEKAFLMAQERDTANKEISLRDILEATQNKPIAITKDKAEYRKKRVTSLIALSGAVYSVLGILIYLFQNKKFAVETDLGLIIAITGVIISLVGFVYGQLLTRRYFDLNFSEKRQDIVSSSDFEIIKRWQIIEQLTTKIMSEKGIIDSNAHSVGQVIRFLTDKFAKNEKEFIKIRELLQMRNRILHEQYSMTEEQRLEYLRMADDLIERLERTKS